MLIKDYQIVDYTIEQFQMLREIARRQGLVIHENDKGFGPHNSKGSLVAVNEYEYCWCSAFSPFYNCRVGITKITATEFLEQYNKSLVVPPSDNDELQISNKGSTWKDTVAERDYKLTQTLEGFCRGPHVLVGDKEVPIRFKDGILPVNIEPVCTLRTLELTLIDHLRAMTLSEVEPTQNLLIETVSILATENITELNKKIEKFIKDLSTEEEC